MLMLCLKEAGLKIAGKKFDDNTIEEGNPNGYWETEATETGLVKKSKGKVVKIMLDALPQSKTSLVKKVVVIFRNPRNVIASTMKHNDMDLDFFVIKSCLDILDGLGWLILHKIPFMFVRYEDLVEHPEKLETICDFTGGKWKKIKCVDKKLNRVKPYEGEVKNLNHWEKMQELCLAGNFKEVVMYEHFLQDEAKRILKEKE